MTVHYRHFDTRWGAARVARCGKALSGVWFLGQKHEIALQADWQEADASDSVLDCFERQWADYEAGKQDSFDQPLAPHGTAFQQSVWQALRSIAYGHTVTYGQVARMIERPTAVRAVGAAIGRNPLSVVIPCHRVLGGTGKLTGYAGGLERKQALLALEQGLLSPVASAATG